MKKETVASVSKKLRHEQWKNKKLVIKLDWLIQACNVAPATIERLDEKGSAIGTMDVLKDAIARGNGK